MQDLTVTVIQSPTYWESVSANLGMFEEKIWEIEEETDVIILPEMFNTGFSMKPEKLSEPMNFTTFKWMKQMAKQTNAVITGSLIIKEKGDYFNRLIWMEPDGNYYHYDKRHLFRMANEHDHYSGGTERLILDYKGWKICPLICYDLRFPVWSRNSGKDITSFDYDLLLYVANWPAARVNAWDTLLRARAIENLSYCIGVNRIGKDGMDIPHNGHSAILDPKGYELFYAEDQEVIKTLTLSYTDLIAYRNKFPANKDADDFTIHD